MKRIDLGHGAVAFEPNVVEDRIDTVADEVFARNNLSAEAEKLYKQFKSSVQSQSAGTLGSAPKGLGEIKER